MATPPTQTVNEAISRPDDDLCLAYANTRYWRGTAAPTEDLSDLDDLLRWAASAERLPQPLIDRFSAYWRGSPDEAATSFRDARFSGSSASTRWATGSTRAESRTW